MVIPTIAARNALYNRLLAVFGSEAFGTIYPDTAVPDISMGFPANTRPFFVVVDEIVDDARPVKGATMGMAGYEFAVNVWIGSRHSDLEKASDTAMRYADCVIGCVLADQSLGGSVDTSLPEISSGGTAADGDKKYIATEVVRVVCTVWATCPQAIREVIDESS